MLPTSSSVKGRSGPNARPDFLPDYLRRIVKWQQMDIEYTFWQMLHLCTSPKVVYQHTKYHKQTKNQWARDDPAFVVMCSLLLLLSTIAYCAAYDHSVGHAVFVVLSVLIFHFLVAGTILATLCWFFTNNYLREEAINSHVVEQRVECCSLFPITDFARSRVFTCAAIKFALHVLPFLERTAFFLYPIGAIIVLSPILTLCGFNPSRYFMDMYFSRSL